MHRVLPLLLVLAALVAEEPTPWPVTQVVFQYAATVVKPDAKPDAKPCVAYLWVPPAATRIRGLLIGGTVLFEGAFAAHPAIRAACAEAGLGIILFSPHLDAVFDPAKSGLPLQQSLDQLAAVSGRPEIASAPLLPYGHSVGTIWTRNLLFWKPERCFGGIFFKGGFGIPDGHALGELAGIPLIHVQGRFEEFGPGPSGALRGGEGEDRTTGGKSAMQQLAAHRAADPRFLISLLVEDGSTHFAMNERVALHLAKYIQAAAALRLPAAEGPLIAVDPARGAYSASGDLFTKPAAPAAAVAAYTGDAKATFWHPSVELAVATDAFHAADAAKKPQYVAFADAAGKPIAVGHDMRIKLNPQWVGADSAKLAATFWSTIPDKYPQVAGEVGHASGQPELRVFSGPIEPIGPDTFRMTMDTRLGDRPFVLVWHPGDATYRPAEQPGNLRMPDRLKGPAQAITFANIGTVAQAALPLALKATSDSGLPVRFHVDHGPARVVAGKLELDEVPTTATWPLEIEVVAWQYGSAIEPKFASAVPVRQIVRVSR